VINLGLSTIDSLLSWEAKFLCSKLVTFILGHVLKNHTVAVYGVTSETACGLKCLQHDTCLSYNYKPISVEQRKVCELKDANRVTCPSCFVIEQNTTYYEHIKVLNNKKRLSLGQYNEEKYSKVFNWRFTRSRLLQTERNDSFFFFFCTIALFSWLRLLKRSRSITVRDIQLLVCKYWKEIALLD